MKHAFAVLASLGLQPQDLHHLLLDLQSNIEYILILNFELPDSAVL